MNILHFWDKACWDVLVDYLHANLRNLGRNSKKSNIFTDEMKLDIAGITETHWEELQKVKLIDWAAKNAWRRQREWPASSRDITTRSRVKPKQKRECRCVTGQLVKAKRHVVRIYCKGSRWSKIENCTCYLSNTCMLCAGRWMAEVSRGRYWNIFSSWQWWWLSKNKR